MHDEDTEFEPTAYEIVHCMHEDNEPVVHLTLSYAEVSLIAMALTEFVPGEIERARLQFLKSDDPSLKASLCRIAGYGEAALIQWQEMEEVMAEPMAEYIDWHEWTHEMEAEA
jgi:hypothetical protein